MSSRQSGGFVTIHVGHNLFAASLFEARHDLIDKNRRGRWRNRQTTGRSRHNGDHHVRKRLR
ncbi:hypothetical protein KVC_1943 [Ketogulonicigenium vulgare]|uniref:Uncharacterized protein n=1 Tax=Ketogulonicigenium vulgare (strain WSH-001) TaxID=759362 RepID=F9Y8Q0_KETVW|nr:hypothetical protein KVU_1381 [Ketogulonicigenium vulgare WSH-001]AOZ54950.1 hypothetical protein KVC_1943 [Ketogulonicigenium vulgare]